MDQSQDRRFTIGQRVLYSMPSKGKKYDDNRDRPATVLKEWDARVKLEIEFKPGQMAVRMVKKDRVKVETE